MKSKKYNKKIKECFFINRNLEYYCIKISNSNIFNFLTILIIIMNCIITAIELTKKFDYFHDFEIFFLIYYSFEMLIKMKATNLFKIKFSYFNNYWNIFDFIVTISSVISFFLANFSFNITVFRILRILNALNIKKLKRTFEGILASFNLMKQTFLILIGFILIYSTIGNKMFYDLLKFQCFHPNLGSLFLTLIP